MTTSEIAMVLWPSDFMDLVDARHRRRIDRRLARPVEDHAAAGAGEQRQDDRMLGQDVLAEDRAGIVVEREHADVELQHIPGREIGRRGGVVPVISAR